MIVTCVTSHKDVGLCRLLSLHALAHLLLLQYPHPLVIVVCPRSLHREFTNSLIIIHLLYFRIIVGGGIRDCVVPDSVNVFKFDEEYSLKQTLVSMIRAMPLCFDLVSLGRGC